MTSFIVDFICDLVEKQQQPQQTVCNYSDNYYGDQVCTPVKES